MIRGGTYHVMNRGIRKVIIFCDQRDRKRFTRILIETAKEHGVEVQAGTQMTTHFHVIVVTPFGNISDFMRTLESRFAQYSNWRYGHCGHVFQRRFKAVVIENDIHLFTALWYVFNNPKKAGLVERLEDWPWSTYAATIGLTSKPAYLCLDWLETLFPADTFQASQRLFRDCMNDPDPVRRYLLAVDPTSAEAIRSYVAERLREMTEPASYRELFRPAPELLFQPTQAKVDRDNAIAIAHVTHGYTLAEIATFTGLHPGSVSRIFRAVQRSKTAPDTPAEAEG
jgi:REP element-mobilizing transposase RayT